MVTSRHVERIENTEALAASTANPAPAWNEYDANLTKEIINNSTFCTYHFLPKTPSTQLFVISSARSSHAAIARSLVWYGHVQEPVLGLLKGIEKRDPDIPVSVAASMVNSHYLGFSGFATGFSFANGVLNRTASLMGVSKDHKVEREDIMRYIVNSQIRLWNHHWPFGTEVDFISIIKINPNVQKSHTHSLLKVLGLKVQNYVEDKKLCKEYWEGTIPFWEKFGQPILGNDNLPEVGKSNSYSYPVLVT
ncbi:uncharacterized protein EAF02_000832 [Botrytis sinoallii]|uniref:uncharacterized protein n=1 Tax=Botrytis sinoallii TaxID=1463999 RepID=UPI001901B13E|nr:uncharacterized protein EAF02_000832 [Botrytis sinoallii]KAF7893294.1 hypothetical protein EAF02_000832 [Botrytis sinoallii]